MYQRNEQARVWCYKSELWVTNMGGQASVHAPLRWWYYRRNWSGYQGRGRKETNIVTYSNYVILGSLTLSQGLTPTAADSNSHILYGSYDVSLVYNTSLWSETWASVTVMTRTGCAQYLVSHCAQLWTNLVTWNLVRTNLQINIDSLIQYCLSKGTMDILMIQWFVCISFM